MRRQLPSGARRCVLTEPFGRNTAAAIALAAIHARHAAGGDAVLAVLPADHYIQQPALYREIVSAALDAAREPSTMIVLGIPPTRPDTGFGYIERSSEATVAGKFPGVSGAALYRKACVGRCKGICGIGPVSLERGNVFLAGLHVSGRAAKISTKDACGAGSFGAEHRQKRLCAQASLQPTSGWKISPWTTRFSNRPRARPALPACS